MKIIFILMLALITVLHPSPYYAFRLPRMFPNKARGCVLIRVQRNWTLPLPGLSSPSFFLVYPLIPYLNDISFFHTSIIIHYFEDVTLPYLPWCYLQVCEVLHSMFFKRNEANQTFY